MVLVEPIKPINVAAGALKVVRCFAAESLKCHVTPFGVWYPGLDVIGGEGQALCS